MDETNPGTVATNWVGYPAATRELVDDSAAELDALTAPLRPGPLLGRYWRRGPQRTLFVPRPVTRAGRNRIVVLELESFADPVIRLRECASLGHTEV